MNPLGLRCLYALATLHLLTAQSGYAAGRVSTRQSGIVVSVDQARRSFAVRPDGEAEEVVIEWRTKSEFFGGSKTEFFAGADPADSAILKKRNPGVRKIPGSPVRSQCCHPRPLAQTSHRGRTLRPPPRPSVGG